MSNYHVFNALTCMRVMQLHAALSFIKSPHQQVMLARDAFVTTNRRAIAMLFVALSVCLSVWDGRAL